MSAALRLAIVGGGYTGAVLAIHAIRAADCPLDITMIEPSADIGRGTAYGTADEHHRINVPSDRMALSVDDPDEATRWLFAHGILPDPASDDGSGAFYVPRRSYGAFVSDALAGALSGAGQRVRFRHRRSHATAIGSERGLWRIACDDGGGPVTAERVALCFGHSAPSAPCPISATAARHRKFVGDPWSRNALAAIEPHDAVLIVGTGLTMADVVMSLTATGHAGPVTAVSRRGLLPLSHGLFRADLDIFGGDPPPRTALGLSRLLRRQARASAAVTGWQPVIDSLRAVLPVVWAALPVVERRRVVRRLLPFWEVHRFRIAPQVGATLKHARAGGRLTVLRAGLAGLDRHDGSFSAALRLRGGERATRSFDAAVLCTGPDRDLRRNPLVAALLADGLARIDDVGIGLAVDPFSRLLDADGRPQTGLSAFGPMTRGSFGEMTGAPDIARHVEKVVGDWLGGYSDDPGDSPMRAAQRSTQGW